MEMLSENSLKLLRSRYLLRGAQGNICETPDELFRRVAKAVAAAEHRFDNGKAAEQWEQRFYTIMSGLLFLPNSPTLMNAGTNRSQLSACFVLPVEDSMYSIFSALKNAALIQQSGGGTGFNFSKLRPKDDPLFPAGGTASGPVSFIKIFDTATEHIKQGGVRRGANMGILNIDHPDIEAFVVSKKKESVLRNFNISVGVTDQFMQALENNADWDLVHPNSKKTVKRISTKKIWDDIVEAAWQTGDPGLVFLDTINRFNPTPALGNIEATNPCGEVPLLANESCNLGSVNLSKCVKNKNGHPEVDWRLLEEVIQIAIRFLDNVIEVNNYLIPEIKEMAMGNRKTGLGVMGWADMLALLELPYASEKATKLGEQLMQFIEHKSRETSEALAAERGAFPNWKKSIYYPGRPIRNATRTSIAPTGSISIIANTSSSIEPLFAHAFKRMHVLNNETINAVNPILINYLRSHKLYSEKIYRQILEEGVAAQVSELPDAVKDMFKTALEIPPVWHLQHQLVFQKYTDNAVSKTINLPETASLKDVDEIYRTAWRFRAKGITVFRNHSKGTQVMYPGFDQKEKICRVCKE